MVPTCSALARKPDKLTILRMAVSHMKSMRGTGNKSTDGAYKPSFLTEQVPPALLAARGRGRAGAEGAAAGTSCRRPAPGDPLPGVSARPVRPPGSRLPRSERGVPQTTVGVQARGPPRRPREKLCGPGEGRPCRGAGGGWQPRCSGGRKGHCGWPSAGLPRQARSGQSFPSARPFAPHSGLGRSRCPSSPFCSGRGQSEGAEVAWGPRGRVPRERQRGRLGTRPECVGRTVSGVWGGSGDGGVGRRAAHPTAAWDLSTAGRGHTCPPRLSCGRCSPFSWSQWPPGAPREGAPEWRDRGWEGREPRGPARAAPSRCVCGDGGDGRRGQLRVRRAGRSGWAAGGGVVCAGSLSRRAESLFSPCL